MVSKLNPAQRSVTVEWYERGETKGKEVELDMLLALNPELIQNKQSYAPPPSATAPVNLQRVSRFELSGSENPPMPSWPWDIKKLCYANGSMCNCTGNSTRSEAPIHRACLHGYHRCHRHGLLFVNFPFLDELHTLGTESFGSKVNIKCERGFCGSWKRVLSLSVSQKVVRISLTSPCSQFSSIFAMKKLKPRRYLEKPHDIIKFVSSATNICSQSLSNPFGSL